MSNVTALVDARSWVLEVTGAWPASAVLFGGGETVNHPDFPLTPDATPKVVLTVTGSGFTRSGGQAVAANPVRTVVATKPLRKPYNVAGAPAGSLLGNNVLDERDNGNGTRTVWLALSEPIYAGETVTVSFAAGWRTGQAAASGVAVTNNSNRAYPIPIMRWASPQQMPVIGTSTVRVDVLAASHFPRHFGATSNQALAAVEFQVTDRTTTKSVWVTQDSVSPSFGDNLLCWGATLDLDGLTAGGCQVRAIGYPWLGVPRTLGTTWLTTNAEAHGVAADIPLLLGYDPNDSFFGRRYVFVNAATGTTTVANVTVGTTLAGARAGTAAATVSVALQAMRTAAFTLPAANGFAGATFAAPYWEIVLAPGVQTVGTQAISTGFDAGLGHIVVRGDPADSNPRVNCVWRTMASAPSNLRNTQWRIEDVRLEMGDAVLLSTGAVVWLNRVTGAPKTGASNLALFFVSSNPAAGLHNLYATQFAWQNYGALGGTGAARPVLLRAGTVSTARAPTDSTSAKVLVNLTALPFVGHTYGVGSSVEFGVWNVVGSDTPDNMAWGLRSLHNNGRLYGFTKASGSGTLADPEVYLRNALVNCLATRANVEIAFNLGQIGENAYNRGVDCIIEGNTIVGQRFNWHNDPPDPAQNFIQTGNRIANNYFDWQPTKHDVFVTANGNRTGSWELMYGVQHFANVDAHRNNNTPNFQREYYGLQTFVDPAWPGNPAVGVGRFVDDRSNFGLNAVAGIGPGGGDYRPGAGSELLGRAVAGNTGRDNGGAVRGAVFASGALEPAGVPAPAAMLWIDDAVHAVAAVAPRLWADVRLRVSGGRHGIDATDAVLRVGRPPEPPIVQGRVLRIRDDPRILRTDGE